MTAEEWRFWKKVDIKEDNDCWLWLAGRSNTTRLNNAYGSFFLNNPRGMYPAHRIAWIFTYGPIPDGLQVLHSCDNPPCCNPSHLFLGTQLDNIQDRVNKCRSNRIVTWTGRY